jgi:hypothetical protein
VPFCALTPIAGGAIGRGYGRGYNRNRTATDQLHAGQDFVALAGTPVLAPLPGRVVFVSSNEGPRITAERAKEGAVGQVRGMGGYGNALVLQHDFQLPAPGVLPSRQNPPALPASFWTSYNHLRERPALRPGDRVSIGQVIGYVGNTTNGQFAGMGAHLHFEVRKRAFPGSYNTDTVDPNVLWYSLGFTNPGARLEIQRTVGGDIVATPGGPSACAPAQTTLAGFESHFFPGLGELGTAPVVEPPDYNPEPAPGVSLPVPRNCPGGARMLLPGTPCPGSGGGGGGGIAVIAGVLLFGAVLARAGGR